MGEKETNGKEVRNENETETNENWDGEVEREYKLFFWPFASWIADKILEFLNIQYLNAMALPMHLLCLYIYIYTLTHL